jgi:hypothetical protein
MYYEISDSTQEEFFGIFNKKAFPISIRFIFIGNEKQKNLIKISKVPDQFAFSMSKDLLISMNETLMDKFDDESISILIEQEIDKISVDINSGKIKLIKPDLSTFSSIINKYGVEKVSRANGIEELYHQQVKDGQELIS